MRILHFCPLPLFSGLEQYALELAVRQKKLGHETAMVVLKGSALQTECEKAGIPTHVVFFSKPVPLLSAASQYREILAKYRDLDVIHLHTSHDIERLRLTFGLRGWPHPTPRPALIQQNHIWISHGKRDPLHWFTYRMLDEVWCSSEPAKKDLVRFLPFPAERIRVIKYGRDLSLKNQLLTREQARTELQLPIEATILGAIARIDRGKGIWELLHGSLEVMREAPDLHLAIIGGPTLSDPKSLEFTEEVEKAVASLPPELQSRVHMKGAIAGAAKFLKAFDLYAQVSYKETFSLALLDAQLSERPVLGTESGGTPEVVRENLTGWLCKPEDSSSLAASLRRALADRGSWADYGKRARERVEKEFDFDTVVNEILSRYQAAKRG